MKMGIVVKTEQGTHCLLLRTSHINSRLCKLNEKMFHKQCGGLNPYPDSARHTMTVT